MNIASSDRRAIAVAFFGGQVVMLGAVYALKPTSASAQATSQSLASESLFIRRGTTGAGIQIAAIGAGGGPGLTFFDAAGASRMQLSLDGAGKPTVILRGKKGDIAVGLGLQNDDQPTIAIRSRKGNLVTLPVPDN